MSRRDRTAQATTPQKAMTNAPASEVLAAKQENDRVLKAYNTSDSCPEAQVVGGLPLFQLEETLALAEPSPRRPSLPGI